MSAGWSWRTSLLAHWLVARFMNLSLSENDGLQPGTRVRDVAYIGFIEVEIGGVAEIGDEVWAGELRLGALAGFDLTHYPNHLNIVLSTEAAKTGAELGLQLGTRIIFRGDPHATRPT